MTDQTETTQDEHDCAGPVRLNPIPLDDDAMYQRIAEITVTCAKPTSFGIEMARTITNAIHLRYRTSNLVSEIDGKNVPTRAIAMSAVSVLCNIIRRQGAQGNFAPPFNNSGANTIVDRAFDLAALVVGGKS